MNKENINLEELSNFIKSIAKEAGNILLKIYSKKDLQHKMKGEDDTNNLVTEADEAANKFLINEIRSHYPDHGIMSEEGEGINPNAEYLWILDPLDGTVNFKTHNPLFGTVVAILQNKKPLMSAIYMPVVDELYFAQRGNGSYLNGERIQGSKTTSLVKSVGCIPSHNKPGQWPLYMYENACKKKAWANALGSAAVMAVYVAAGRRDWYVSSDKDVWDLAPQVLLLEEAGCPATDSNGKPWSFESRELVTANKELHPELLELVKEIKKEYNL